MHENEIGTKLLDAAFKVHSELGAGLLENVYELCLAHELQKSGLFFEVQKPLPVVYQSLKLEGGYRVDFIIEKKVIVEIKSVEVLHPVFEAQLLTYLKLSQCKLGYLINFNVKLLKEGIMRRVMGDISNF